MYLTRAVCKLMPALVDYMNVANICTYLLAEELLTFDERNEILELQGKHRQVPYLFEVLSTKGKDWYCRFWRALKNSVSWNADIHLGHMDLLEMLPNASDEKTSMKLELEENGKHEIFTLNNEMEEPPTKNEISESIAKLECRCEQLQEEMGYVQKCSDDLTLENQLLTQENEILRQENTYLVEKLESRISETNVKKDNKSTWV